MKVLIAYYSFTGNTKKAAEALATAAGADIVQIEPVKDTNYLMKCVNAFLKKKTPIKPVTTDLKAYDAIVIGSPVWASGAPPGLNQYLDELKGYDGKKFAVIVTYGGSGQAKVLSQIKSTLDKKNMSFLDSLFVKQGEENYQDRVNALAARLK